MLFVDLAGSERILKTGVEGVARAQAMCINSSLTALGKVIRSLAEKAAHVPYRDSTLTMLLRASLSGHASTAVVIQAATDAEHAEESLCSLEFGQRMGRVRSTVAVAATRDLSADAAALHAQLDRERAALAALEVRSRCVCACARALCMSTRKCAPETEEAHGAH